MSQKVHDLLKRINYIEADLELQKQILFSIPSNEKKKMEEVIKTIAAKHDEIAALRDAIKKEDPEEYNRIITFEKAAAQFKKIAEKKTFRHVTTKNENEACQVTLTDETIIDCLVKAEDDGGNWTLLTADGQLLQLNKNEVAS